jgi:hypothetical protein
MTARDWGVGVAVVAAAGGADRKSAKIAAAPLPRGAMRQARQHFTWTTRPKRLQVAHPYHGAEVHRRASVRPRS